MNYHCQLLPRQIIFFSVFSFTMLFVLPRLCRRHLTSYVQRHFRQLTTGIPNVCIVGAGPAGFYAAQQILKVCM